MSKLADRALLPFYGLIALYFLDQLTSGLWHNIPAIPVLLKIGPIWYLFAYLRFLKTPTKGKRPNGKPQFSLTTESTYRNYISLGLAVSSIGDVIMEHPSGLIPGGFVFGIAHILYVIAFRKRGTNSKHAWLVLPLACLLLYTVMAQMSSPKYMLFAFLYNIMLSWTAMSAIACHEDKRSSSTLLAAIGASVFYASDYIIAYTIFVSSVPYSDIIIMVAYYSAQLLIALSVH